MTRRLLALCLVASAVTACAAKPAAPRQDTQSPCDVNQAVPTKDGAGGLGSDNTASDSSLVLPPESRAKCVGSSNATDVGSGLGADNTTCGDTTTSP